MRLNVEGMTCAHCERSVRQAVEALGGTARVDLASGTVEVEGIEDAGALRHAIEGEGYRVVDTVSRTPKAGDCCCSKR